MKREGEGEERTFNPVREQITIVRRDVGLRGDGDCIHLGVSISSLDRQTE